MYAATLHDKNKRSLGRHVVYSHVYITYGTNARCDYAGSSIQVPRVCLQVAFEHNFPKGLDIKAWKISPQI